MSRTTEEIDKRFGSLVRELGGNGRKNALAVLRTLSDVDLEDAAKQAHRFAGRREQNAVHAEQRRRSKASK